MQILSLLDLEPSRRRPVLGLVASCLLSACVATESEPFADDLELDRADLEEDPWRLLEQPQPSAASVLSGAAASGAAIPDPSWARTGGGGLNDILWDMAITDDGLYVVAVGEQANNNPALSIQGLVLVLNAHDGSTHCSQTVGGSGIEYFQGLALDGNTIYASGGRARGSFDTPFVAKLSVTNCVVEWANPYKFTSSNQRPEVAFDVAVAGPGGNIMVVGAGGLNVGLGQGVPFTAELNPAGVVQRAPSFPLPPVSIITGVERLDLSPTDSRWALVGGTSSGPAVLQISDATLLPIPGTGRQLPTGSNLLITAAAKNRFTGEEVVTVDGDTITSLSGTLATLGSFNIPATTPLPFSATGVDVNSLGVICAGGSLDPVGQPSTAAMLTFLATPNPTPLGGALLPEGAGSTSFGAAAAGPDGCYAAGVTARGAGFDWYIVKTSFTP